MGNPESSDPPGTPKGPGGIKSKKQAHIKSVGSEIDGFPRKMISGEQPCIYNSKTAKVFEGLSNELLANRHGDTLMQRIGIMAGQNSCYSCILLLNSDQTQLK